jgi:hypothetical protein
MKNTLFIATYFNNAHFIELQSKCFQKYIEDDYDFAVINDSEDNTKSILSGNSSNSDIQEACAKFSVKHIRVPQSIHAYYSQGGYVPNENPTVDHPTDRHQAVIRWLFKNYKELGFDQYKTLALLDADVFFKQKTNISNFMEYDIIGTGRSQAIKLQLGSFPDKMFPQKVKDINNKTINFLTFFILFINIQKINNLEALDVGSWPGTDTGAKSSFFIQENQQYTHSYLNDRHVSEYRIDVVSKSNLFDEDSAELIHFRAGSNWLYEGKDYYNAKLNKMLKRYLPEFCTNDYVQHTDLVSRDGEHTVKKG